MGERERSGSGSGDQRRGRGSDPQATRPISSAPIPAEDDPWAADAEDMATRPAIPAAQTQPIRAAQRAPTPSPARSAGPLAPAPRAPSPRAPAPSAPAPQRGAPRAPLARRPSAPEPEDPWAVDAEDMATRVVPKGGGPDAISTLPDIPTPPKGGPRARPTRAPSPAPRAASPGAPGPAAGSPPAPQRRTSLYRSPDLDAHLPSTPRVPSAFPTPSAPPTDALATYVESGDAAARHLSRADDDDDDALATRLGGPKHAPPRRSGVPPPAPPRRPPSAPPRRPAAASPSWDMGAFDEVEETISSGQTFVPRSAMGHGPREDEPTDGGATGDLADLEEVDHTIPSGFVMPRPAPKAAAPVQAERTATADIAPPDAGDPLETRLGAAVNPRELATRQLSTPEVPVEPELDLEIDPPTHTASDFDTAPTPAPPQGKPTAMLPVAPASGPYEDVGATDLRGELPEVAYGADLRFLENDSGYDPKPVPRAGAPDVGTFLDTGRDTARSAQVRQPTFNWGVEGTPEPEAPFEGRRADSGDAAMEEYRRKQKAKAHWYGSYTAYDIPVAMNLSPGLIPGPLPGERLSDWFRDAWDAFLDNPVSFVLAQAIVMGMVVLSGGLLIGPAMTGYLYYMGRVVRGEEDANPFDIFEVFGRFSQAFWMGIFVWFALGGVLFAAALMGYILDMIPYLGFLLQMVLNLAASVAVAAAFPIVCLSFGLMWNREDGVPTKDLFLAILRLLGQDPQAAVMYGLLVGLLGASGLLGFGLGVLVTGPMAVWIMATAYETVFEAERATFEAQARAAMEN